MDCASCGLFFCYLVRLFDICLEFCLRMILWNPAQHHLAGLRHFEGFHPLFPISLSPQCSENPVAPSPVFFCPVRRDKLLFTQNCPSDHSFPRGGKGQKPVADVLKLQWSYVALKGIERCLQVELFLEIKKLLVSARSAGLQKHCKYFDYYCHYWKIIPEKMDIHAIIGT